MSTPQDVEEQESRESLEEAQRLRGPRHVKPIGRKIRIQGTVQGVGFRPWVYRLARRAELAGTVRNDASGVTIEAFGDGDALDRFVRALQAAPPPAAVIETLQHEPLPWRQVAAFAIVPSRGGDERQVSIPPDLAVCGACLLEVATPGDRRYRYPFTNCTDCGPRFTITLDLPYDRPATTMAEFVMCPNCRREYEDPGDRRFHAQPNACSLCGPRLLLRAASGDELAVEDEALRRAARELAAGRIVAVKGLGGFHLMVDARDGEAVARLRRRKARYDKPLALMVKDLDAIRRLCELPSEAADLLDSIEAPIVLLRRLEESEIASEVAPGHPDLGIMLPYTPLHQLLLGEVDFPLVATSGNLSDEPICIDNQEALSRLGAVADFFLVHDRTIARHADDSVAWILDGRPALVRRARGYAPSPVPLPRRSPGPMERTVSAERALPMERVVPMEGAVPTVLAVGGHLKNTVALSLGRNVLISQHIGDMETPQARQAFEGVIADLLRMCEAEPVAVAHDLHPDYPSTGWARAAVAGGGSLAGLPLVAVQHHHAHLASCLAENGVEGPALGVTWDGTGYGSDGSVWGGEFLLGDARGFERVAHLRPFRLPGGDAAVKAPHKVALALLWEVYGAAMWEQTDLPVVSGLSTTEARLYAQMLSSGVRSPITTSAGRLFDGVAALVGLRQEISYEGQAAMELEFVSSGEETGAYPVDLGESSTSGEGCLEIDWRPMVAELLADWRAGRGAGIMGARFHNALVETIVQVADRVGESRSAESRVALSGGCFQNRRLTEGCIRRLRRVGHRVLVHRRVPANDGGISLGQVAVAAVAVAVARPGD